MQGLTQEVADIERVHVARLQPCIRKRGPSCPYCELHGGGVLMSAEGGHRGAGEVNIHQRLPWGQSVAIIMYCSVQL